MICDPTHLFYTSPPGDSDTEDQTTKPSSKYQWAVELDAELDVPEFYSQIVNLAYEFPFELDPFQKQVPYRCLRVNKSTQLNYFKPYFLTR